jgi:2,5-furandicarboxylate decarboxylase 1
MLQPVSPSAIDLDKFRLRRFVERLFELGEVVVHEDPVALAELSAAIASTPKAMLFKNAGPDHLEMVAAVCGSRRRLAAAFGVDERQVAHEYMRRLGNAQPVIEVTSQQAPVHQLTQTGEAIDLAKLPFHLQHEYDGGVYISAGIDYAVDPTTGKRNVGCRRLMLRSRNTMRANLTDASDLKLMYLACLERGERLPVSYVIGSHPLDYLAATQRQPVDEFALVGTLRASRCRWCEA